MSHEGNDALREQLFELVSEEAEKMYFISEQEKNNFIIDEVNKVFYFSISLNFLSKYISTHTTDFKCSFITSVLFLIEIKISDDSTNSRVITF